MPAVDAYRAVVDKRDQRAFLPTPLPEVALQQILQSGRMTGSSKNREPNRFVVVRDRQRLAALAALSRYARWLDEAAAAIVIVQTEPHEFDAGRCAQNMMVAADLPAAVAVNRVIGFGYVEASRAPPPSSVARRRRPLSELVHWERWL